MRDVLIQRGQVRPLSGEAKTFQGMTNDGWEVLDLLAMSTITLWLADNVYYIILDCDLAEKLWNKLCRTYEKETASSKVYLIRKIYDLHIKDANSAASHLNDFDALWFELQAQKMTMDDELKIVLLFCT